MSEGKVKISELIPDDQNFNTGNEFGESLIEKSFDRFGAGRSILVDKKNRVIAGNKSLQKFAESGGENVIVVETTGKEIVAVKRTDIDLDTKRGREMALADNATAKANITWDTQALLDWEMPTQEWGVELKVELIDDAETRDAEPQTDRAAELNEKWQVKLGDVFQIGNHRLICGDSTKAEDVEKVLDGATPNICVSDPPYGVEYDANWRNEAAEKGSIGYAARATGTVLNDDRVDWTAAYELFKGNVAYLWHAGKYTSEVQASIELAGFEIRSQIIWAKPNFAISRGHYHWQHEPCWYAVRRGANATWAGDHSQTTLWTISRDAAVEGGHSTQKPLECMSRPIANHEGDVYEPFAGTGTTIVASQNLGRTCYAIELNPDYCAVILERMQTAFPELDIVKS